jgi:hypothetical protein
VHVLSLQFVETSKFLLKFINGAKATATVGGEEGLAIRFLDTEALPEALNGGADLLNLALTSLLLFH